MARLNPGIDPFSPHSALPDGQCPLQAMLRNPPRMDVIWSILETAEQPDWAEIPQQLANHVRDALVAQGLSHDRLQYGLDRLSAHGARPQTVEEAVVGVWGRTLALHDWVASTPRELRQILAPLGELDAGVAQRLLNETPPEILWETGRHVLRRVRPTDRDAVVAAGLQRKRGDQPLGWLHAMLEARQEWGLPLRALTAWAPSSRSRLLRFSNQWWGRALSAGSEPRLRGLYRAMGPETLKKFEQQGVDPWNGFLQRGAKGKSDDFDGAFAWMVKHVAPPKVKDGRGQATWPLWESAVHARWRSRTSTGADSDQLELAWARLGRWLIANGAVGQGMEVAPLPEFLNDHAALRETWGLACRQRLMLTVAPASVNSPPKPRF